MATNLILTKPRAAQLPRIRCIQGPFLLEFAHFARFALVVFQGAVDFQTALPVMRSATGTDCSGCGHRALLLRPHMQRTLPRCSDRVGSAKALCLRRNGSLESKLSDKRSDGFWHASFPSTVQIRGIDPRKSLVHLEPCACVKSANIQLYMTQLFRASQDSMATKHGKT